jgi:hypothetical protein
MPAKEIVRPRSSEAVEGPSAFPSFPSAHWAQSAQQADCELPLHFLIARLTPSRYEFAGGKVRLRTLLRQATGLIIWAICH